MVGDSFFPAPGLIVVVAATGELNSLQSQLREERLEFTLYLFRATAVLEPLTRWLLTVVFTDFSRDCHRSHHFGPITVAALVLGSYLHDLP